MKKITAGILAHVDSGKTTLSEALLYETGVIQSLGRVDHQNAFLDTDSDERARGITIYSKNARIPLKEIDTELILIDTPGHVDFGPEMERCLSVFDVAILLISASSGVQAHTKTLWKLLKSYNIPTYIFVNKMDMPDTDKDSILCEIREKLSGDAIDFSYPSGSEFFENIATCHEGLLEEFLESDSLSDESVIGAIEDRRLFPVFFGSALKQEGIGDFIESLARYLVMPSYYKKNSTDTAEKSNDSLMGKESGQGDFSGIVYKISHDEKGARLTYIKITSGSLKVKSLLNEEKINEIRLYSGEKYVNVQEVFPGEICAIAALKNTAVGDTFGSGARSVKPHLLPALSYAVKYNHELDLNTVLKNLQEICEEDPSLNVSYNEETREIQVYLMGDVQAEILMGTIRDRYGIDVSFGDGKVLYKETIDSSFEGVGHFEPLRHYAEAHIELSPNETGAGLSFEADIPEDNLALNWQRLIYTHMTEKVHRGVLLGAPLTDIHMRLVSGKAHLKHTEGGDFRQATYRAIRQGLMELKARGCCHLLEPYYDYTLELPTELVGRAMTDITAMNGSSEITESDSANNISVLCGKVPVSTMNGYSREVAAYSKGVGKLYLSLSGYDRCHNEEEVLTLSKYDPDSDLRNPSSSVFCSHGAGEIIPWDQVPDYMHIEYGTGASISQEGDLKEAAKLNKKRMKLDSRSVMDMALSVEEIDSIIRSSSHANDKGRQGAYKGMSASLREHNRNSSNSTYASTYKGAKIKEKYMLVDGYNVIHAWEDLKQLMAVSLDGAAQKLNDILCNYQAIKGIKLMVVYDAYKVKGRKSDEKLYNNITVVYTGEAQTADQYIERYAHENSSKYDITVVTSDGLEQIIVSGKGATIVSSREFEQTVIEAFKSFNEQFNVQQDD